MNTALLESGPYTWALRSSPAARRRSEMVAIAVAGGLWATLCLVPDLAVKPFAAAAVIVGTAGLLAAAVLVARQAGKRRTGLLLGVSGALWPLSSLGGWSLGPLPVIRSLAESAVWVVLAAAVLLYQHDRLGGWEQLFLGWLAAHLVGGQCVLLLLGRPEWFGYPADSWWPTAVVAPPAFMFLYAALAALYPVDALAFVVLAWWRRKRVGSLDRYFLAPPLASVTLAAVTAGIVWATAGRVTVAVALTMLPVPVAFAYGSRRLSRLRLMVAEGIDEAAESPNAVRYALRRALRDPSLEVRFWSPELGEWVDESGVPSTRDDDPVGRWRIPVARSRGRTGAEVDTVAVSAGSRRGVESAVRLSGPAVENAGLRALLRVQLAASQRVHARSMQVAEQERRDLERDLHDQSQQRLHGLLLLLARARRAAEVNPESVQLLLRRASDETRAVLEELRELAHGLRPSTLSRDGLAAALPEVAERLPVEVTVDDVRLGDEREAAIYLLVCEALTNSVKHADADRAWVRIRETGEAVVVEVADDGVGGADPDGVGVRGMADRVVALGGSFHLRSRVGQGTLVRATLPAG